MSSVISASTTSTTALTLSGDTSGQLEIKTGASPTTAMTIDTSQRVAFVAGTALLPAITTTGDLNTGVFFPAADTIAFTEGGAEAMRIDSSGNVGIGNSSPTSRLDLVRNDSNLLLSLSRNSGADNASIIFKTNAANDVLLDGGGSTQYLRVLTAGSERMRIDSSGNLLVGITSARANAGDVQVSKGISFPATQSAQSDANTLDDYEEGTWTPVVADAATGGNASATTCYGTYTKIGRIVTITCVAPNINTTGLTAGNLVFIRGLPFSSGDISGATAYYVGQTLTSSITVDENPLVYLEDSTKTSVNFADSGNILVSDLSSGTADIYFTLTYQTS